MDGMLNTEAAAKMVNRTPDTLKHWRTMDPPRGPRFYRVGEGPRPRIYYKAGDVERWMAENTKASDAR
jgi:hypothetical protein